MIPPTIPLTSDTPRLHTSMFRAPLWHGATQTHFPPRPRKSAWHCDITNVMSPHGPPHTRSKHISHDTTNHPAHQRHAAFTHQHVSRSPEARRHANTLPTKAAQIPMALRHHERNFRHTVCPRTTSVSYETSSKSHAYSLQNERFVRDFLKNSHVKVCKTSVSYQTSSKSQAETPIGAHTLEILCTQLNAVPHAGLGFQFLRVQVRKPKRKKGNLKGRKGSSSGRPKSFRKDRKPRSPKLNDGEVSTRQLLHNKE